MNFIYQKIFKQIREYFMNRSEDNTDFQLYYSSLVNMHGERFQKKIIIPRKYYIESLSEKRKAETFSQKKPENIPEQNIVDIMAKNLIRENIGNDPLKQIIFLMDFLGRIPLDPIKNKGYIKSPLETLIENNGDRYDLSRLGFSLFRAIGLNPAILDYDGYPVIGIDSSFKPDQYSIQVDNTNYIPLDLPHERTKNFINSENLAIKKELRKQAVSDIKQVLFSPEARKLTSMLNPANEVRLFGDESGIKPEKYNRFFSKCIYGLGEQNPTVIGLIKHILGLFQITKESFSFVYNVFQDNYIQSGEIQREETYDLFQNRKHMSLVDSDDPTVQAITDFIFNERFQDISQENIPEYEGAQLILDFVQKLPHVSDRKFDYPKHPAETLAEFSGDCEDYAILAASMMAYAGLDVVILGLGNKESGHAAVGVHIPENQKANILKYTRGTFKEYKGKKYYICETTGTLWQHKPFRAKIGWARKKYMKNVMVNRVLKRE